MESCTALIEDHAGELKLVYWFEDDSLPEDKLKTRVEDRQSAWESEGLVEKVEGRRKSEAEALPA